MSPAPVMNAAPEHAALAAEAEEPGPMEALRRLRFASDALAAQLSLHGKLAEVEWADEKLRLGKLLVAAFLGSVFFLCACVFIGVLLLSLGWQYGYLIPAAMVLIVIYLVGTLLAWRKVQALLVLSVHCFAASRAELAADIAMLRDKL